MHDEGFPVEVLVKTNIKGSSDMGFKIQDSANSFNQNAHEACWDGEGDPYLEAGSPDDGT
jgi:hypothetical protein